VEENSGAVIHKKPNKLPRNAKNIMSLRQKGNQRLRGDNREPGNNFPSVDFFKLNKLKNHLT
jgi:hypothetical protein